jgi:hypothetical protein
MAGPDPAIPTECLLSVIASFAKPGARRGGHVKPDHMGQSFRRIAMRNIHQSKMTEHLLNELIEHDRCFLPQTAASAR